MNATIVYQSHHGNTAFVAGIMAEALAREGSVHLVRIDQATEAQVTESDLLLFGGPAPDLNGAYDILAWLERLPRAAFDRASIAVFDTQLRSQRTWAESTASALAKAVHQAGGMLILPPESFFLVFRAGPLDDGELARAANWAREAWERGCQRTEEPMACYILRHVSGLRRGQHTALYQPARDQQDQRIEHAPIKPAHPARELV
jgi:flavodoxin